MWLREINCNAFAIHQYQVLTKRCHLTRLENIDEVRAESEINLPQRDRIVGHEKPLDRVGGRKIESTPIQRSQRNRIGCLCASVARDSSRSGTVYKSSQFQRANEEPSLEGSFPDDRCCLQHRTVAAHCIKRLEGKGPQSDSLLHHR